MKTKYTIPTFIGTITRTTERKYTHVVVCGQATKVNPNTNEVCIYNIKEVGTGFLVGFASSKELAMRLTRSWQIKSAERIDVVEITQDMMREIKPRKQQARPKMEFESECFLESSHGSTSLGMRQCSVELFDEGNGRAMIEFIAGQDVEHIGLIYNKSKHVLDYDGVFSVPTQAIDLLKKAGFNTAEIEE